MVEVVSILVILPAVIGLINCFTKNIKLFSQTTTLIGLLTNLAYICVKYNDNRLYSTRWSGFDMQFSIYTGPFSMIMLLCLAILSVIISLYSFEDLKDDSNKNYFYSYFMIAISLCNGTILAANLTVLLFFSVALAIPLLATIFISSNQNQELSKKAFVTFTITSLCLMFGVSIIEITKNTLDITSLNIDIEKITILAFVLIFIDILSKSCFFPFQYWSINLVKSENVSYSLVFPTLIFGLTGTYIGKLFLTDVFNLSDIKIRTVIYILLCIGIVILSVLGFLQKDFRKLIAYIFASQIGFSLMSLTAGGSYGITGAVLNTVNTIVIVSGFYMISGMADYKNRIITGLYELFTLAFVGLPILGGYFSHNLVYSAVYNENVLYFAVLILSTFVLGLALTRFLYCLFKKENDKVGINYIKLVPTAILAIIMILLAVFNKSIISAVCSSLNLQFKDYNTTFIDFITFLIILQLVVIQFLRFRKKESEYFETSCLNIVNNSDQEAEKINIYQITEDIFGGIGVISKSIDDAINWIYDKFIVGLVFRLSNLIRRFQTGNFSTYVVLSVLGFICILIYVLR